MFSQKALLEIFDRVLNALLLPMQSSSLHDFFLKTSVSYTIRKGPLLFFSNVKSIEFNRNIVHFCGS